MQPLNWPTDFIYSSTSFSSEIHPFFLDLLFQSKEAKHIGSICPCLEEKGVHHDVEIKEITKEMKPHLLAGKGQYGAFASSDIPAREVIGEYTGEYTLKQPGKKVHRRGTYGWALTMKGSSIYLYSGAYANEITFVNDYRELAGSPNVSPGWTPHRGKYFFTYTSSKEILKGDEVLVDYGPIWASKLAEKSFMKVHSKGKNLSL